MGSYQDRVTRMGKWTQQELSADWRDRVQGARELPWLSDVPGSAATIDAILERGDAIVIGATSDGGAISLVLLSGKERRKCYAANDDELAAAFADLDRQYPRLNRAMRETRTST